MRLVLGTFYYLFRLSRDPSQYRMIEKFRKLLIDHGYFELTLRHMKNRMGIDNFLSQFQVMPEFSVNDLQKLPAGSFGAELAEFMLRNGLEPIKHSFLTTDTEADFVHRRVVQTHDCWHVALGFGTEFTEEIGLQAFMLEQLRWPNSGFFVGAAIMREMFKNPSAIADLLDAITKGWQTAKHCIPLFSVRWEDEFATPLTELQRKLRKDSQT